MLPCLMLEKLKNSMEKDNNKNIEKLLMALLVSRGISATTLGKMFGVNKSTISRMIPVSEIQEDVKNNGKK